jgi:uncharacterized protein DUF2252
MVLEVRADDPAVVRPEIESVGRAVDADEAAAVLDEGDDRRFLTLGQRQLPRRQGEHQNVGLGEPLGRDRRQILGRCDGECSCARGEFGDYLAGRRNRIVSERGGRGDHQQTDWYRRRCLRRHGRGRRRRLPSACAEQREDDRPTDQPDHAIAFWRASRVQIARAPLAIATSSTVTYQRPMDIRTSTLAYEKWLASQTTIVGSDLIRKHQRMGESAFVFLRGTFYRWIEQWLTVCARLADAPPLPAVGDLHIENFGTWRDAEGRLIWGVNDLDEAAVLPYTNDLVRLATSAVLAAREGHLDLRLGEICDAILDGYATSLNRSGEPIVLAERRRWLRDVALNDLRDPKKFWTRMKALPAVQGRGAAGAVPHDALRALLPRGVTYSVRRRIAGVGSLGRQRFVALAEWEGGFIAREAKALVPSAADRGAARVARQLIETAVRADDPFWTIHQSWIVRRLAPDCSRIEVEDLPKKRDEWKLLRAMGWETANLHLATPRAIPPIARDLRGRRPRWLERAAADMMESTIADWRAWRMPRRA